MGILVFIGIMLLTTVVSAQELHGNCSDTDVSSMLQTCNEKYVTESTQGSVIYTSMDASEDPFALFTETDICNHPEEPANFVYCLREEYAKCHINSSMAMNLPSPEETKKGVIYFCEKIDMVKNTQNITEVTECLQTKQQEVQTCMRGMVSDQVDPNRRDVCKTLDKMESCLTGLEECTGGEPIFKTYMNYVKPERCGACALSATLTLLVLTILAAILN